MNMKCDKCINGVIMKQIAIAEYEPIPCDCVIKEHERRYANWFKIVKRSA